MKEKYKVTVDMYECYDAEGYYAWRITDIDGNEVRKGLSKTSLIGFAEAYEEVERLRNE